MNVVYTNTIYHLTKQLDMFCAYRVGEVDLTDHKQNLYQKTSNQLKSVSS